MSLVCARCQMPLPVWELAGADKATCTSCGSLNTVAVFPAMFRDAAAATRPEAALGGEASCFDHATKRAVAACTQCGRFVCQLCAVEFRGQVWCPACVAAGSGQARVVSPDTSRILYDSIAMTGLILSCIVFWPISVLTGPAALIFAIVNWKKPLSLVRRSRWRFVAAIVLGLLITGGWVVLGVYLMAHWQSGT
jgi:hypothetical protein